VKKPHRRGPAPSASIDTLALRAAEALRQERFREAIDLYKLSLRQEPRPEWKRALAEAYHGRARALAAKRMFKEAAMVLENTLAPDGTLHDPLFYLQCLLRDGQQQKAATHALAYIGRDAALPVDSRARWRS
jgi:tetratricopeptide (TPR) repeat protein